MATGQILFIDPSTCFLPFKALTVSRTISSITTPTSNPTSRSFPVCFLPHAWTFKTSYYAASGLWWPRHLHHFVASDSFIIMMFSQATLYRVSLYHFVSSFPSRCFCFVARTLVFGPFPLFEQYEFHSSPPPLVPTPVFYFFASQSGPHLAYCLHVFPLLIVFSNFYSLLF